MRKKNLKAIFVLAFGALTLTGVVTSVALLQEQSSEVSAGASKSYVASSASISGGVINSGDFYVAGGVHAEGSTLLFDEKCDSTSKIIGKTKIKDQSSYGMSQLINASLSLEAKSFVDDGSFSISFGLPRVSSLANEEGSTELKFTSRSSSLYLSVTEHLSAGDNTILPSEKIDTLGHAANLNFTCAASGALTLSYDGRSYISSDKSITSGVGYVGFFSSGLNSLALTDFSIYGYSYENPENVDYTEYFDNGSYNANLFYSTSSLSGIGPSYLGVDKDTGRLNFRNAGPAHFTTKYLYSNFEMEFDIPTIQREATYDKDGTLTGLISNWFGIAWGLGDPTLDASSTVQTEKWIQYESMPIYNTDHSVKYDNPRLILWDNWSPLVVQSMSFNIFDNDIVHDETVQIKLSVVDGLFKLYNKLSSDVSYGAPVISYDMGETPLGYLRIFTWTPGAIDEAGFKYTAVTNFTVDNLHIVNLDSEAAKKTISDPGYTPNGIALGSDFDYKTEPDPNDLTASLISGSSSSNSPKGLLLSAFALLLCLRRIIKHE